MTIRYIEMGTSDCGLTPLRHVRRASVTNRSSRYLRRSLRLSRLREPLRNHGADVGRFLDVLRDVPAPIVRIARTLTR